jgi:hypothetical protein
VLCSDVTIRTHQEEEMCVFCPQSPTPPVVQLDNLAQVTACVDVHTPVLLINNMCLSIGTDSPWRRHLGGLP